MTAPLQEIDLKTPTQPFAEPPPPYSDYAQQPPYPSTPSYPPPVGFQPSSGFPPSSPQQHPYPHQVGFHVTSPQTEYPPYPIGTGTYPGAGSYGNSNCPQNNSAYIIRTAPVCAATNQQCHIDRMQRRRRILFILAIIVAFICLAIAFGVIRGN
uniref:Uncharacterized protein n=1 Tax=Panagrolaimus superbus TaxID=310955 RepID=A0A914YKE9_9BILA